MAMSHRFHWKIADLFCRAVATRDCQGHRQVNFQEASHGRESLALLCARYSSQKTYVLTCGWGAMLCISLDWNHLISTCIEFVYLCCAAHIQHCVKFCFFPLPKSSIFLFFLVMLYCSSKFPYNAWVLALNFFPIFTNGKDVFVSSIYSVVFIIWPMQNK